MSDSQIVAAENEVWEERVQRSQFHVSVIGGEAARAEVLAKLDAIGEDRGVERVRGSINRSAVVLDLIDRAYDALGEQATE